MHRLFSMFPSGVPGAGLVLLRCGIGLTLWPLPPPLSTHGGIPLCIACMVLLCIFLAIGALTPVVSLICGALEGIALLVSPTAGWNGDSLAFVAAPFALLLVGPGAYSVDYLFYGHRAMKVRTRQR